ncbi:hypothetical protein [Sporosarcina sp. A2]|uniref:hypothetical protein n=1 Tax=Sporosarcina sp. A2 TaxID=3393449 RepID=UPI003D7BE11B
MQTNIISLENPNETRILDVNEEFWSVVNFVAFYSQLIEVRMINGATHSFLHYWAYEVIKDNNHPEEQRQEIYKLEGCSFRFSKDSKEFTNWLYYECKKRDLLLF